MKKTLIVMILLVVNCGIYAQWECPSRLGTSIQPIGNSGFSLGAEFTTSGGWIKDNYAGNVMGILGLNYGTGKNSFYVEGGLKLWTRGTKNNISYSDDGFETFTTRSDHRSSVMAGLREAFYRFSGENNTFTLGLQSARGDEFYLMNERVVGVNYTFRTGRIKFNAIGGSVMEAFARNGRFCTYGYLYNDIVVGRPRSYVGNNFGDTNFGMFTMSFSPEKDIDEFGSSTPKIFSFDRIGVVGYSEFGKKISNAVMSGGFYSELSLGSIHFKPEILYQASVNNKAIIYDMTAEKVLNWNEFQSTRIYTQYVGYTPIDKNARPINSFSNLFMGDALHQDVLEAPVIMLGVKHSFTKIKTSIKIQGILQTKASAMGGNYGFVNDDYTSPLTKMKEMDLGVGKNFGKHLLVNALFGLLDFPSLEHTKSVLHYNHIQTMYGRLECRLTF
jgi:hypothetical protein